MSNSFNSRRSLEIGEYQYQIYALEALEDRFDLDRLPYTHKILLENLLRFEDGMNITKDDVTALAGWDASAEPSQEIAFTPARVLMQDFTGVPAVVDLAAMRDAMEEMGAHPDRINPLSPADLVIDHSVMVDSFGHIDALDSNADLEYRRNGERYSFLKWGQQAFNNFQVVPPATGICHQVNLEYLASVVFSSDDDGVVEAYPDTLVGTDSHTTMINGVGVLGWGVGGIEAEAAMLGQPITMLIPQVIGVRLSGHLPEGTTATDLVLTIVEKLRAKGVVGKFVEFLGDGLDALSLADRATIANMAPEYGATCGIFPIDQETLNFLRVSGRSAQNIELVEAYARRQKMFREPGSIEATYSDLLEVDLGEVVPSIAGPKRPQDRIPLAEAKARIEGAIGDQRGEGEGLRSQPIQINGESSDLEDGAVVIAAITSCTNTSNPGVIMAAGLLAKKAVEKGLVTKPWVKSSLAPGSLVVTDYLRSAGLLPYLEKLGFDVVGYGCTTCIGNSGPLPAKVSEGIREGDLVACSVLSGNRNFEGRVHAEVKMNFLASPPLVVAYALAGTTRIDILNQPLGYDREGNPVTLQEIWPNQAEVNQAVSSSVTREMFQTRYQDVFAGDQRWREVEAPDSSRFSWDERSTYIRRPTYFDGMTAEPEGISEITGARVLARLGDSITTDHISPAGAFKPESPAGKYLREKGVAEADFNSYGSRRGNHEVMMRGTFANIRLRNELAPGTEGGWTRHQPSGEEMSIYDAAIQYGESGVPLIILGGKEYGTGSSRDWAAKGTRLLGVRAVIVESYERIHRSNLIGMGVLPLEFVEGQGRESLGLSGSETYGIAGLKDGVKEVTVEVTDEAGGERSFVARVRIDTPKEWEYYQNGGILQYVLRQLANN
ncbi:MAG: aconitate hydratase AcnA [Acidiferrobacteraceae bacterium]|jgi:aconitate hydratase|nr:aconitate hydratase AcnA [Acidiferrobacteraceae bacterium]MDP6435142.1 aconitate hydratase AcnA [Arenicellales bacterium]MDP6672115.1 aconitate hydratase AcnA [Arenicellales bacterium]MDP6724464.1 aconitate hydratase AcnA [Arenicellales bacterium]MDP7155840.1 aconitate hydratase AcnA [Arenicellales bacterium]|tara:strand:- start:3041 stop:5707 length:2667 start_codon:yes stop_codon:yes gene_type:complete